MRRHVKLRNMACTVYILSQYRVTTIYTVCMMSVYIFVVFVSKISTVIGMISIDSCYFSYITGGYIPTLQLSINAEVFTLTLFLGMTCIEMLAVYFHQLLLIAAYFAVCASISVK